MNNEKKSLARYLCVQAIYQILISEKPFQEVIDEFLNFRVKNFSENFEQESASWLSRRERAARCPVQTRDTPYFCAGRHFVNTSKMPDLFSGSVAGHYYSPHASTLSTENKNENYQSERVYNRFRQQSLISDYLLQQLASDDNLYREQLTEHAPKRV